MIKAKLQSWAFQLLGYPEDVQSLMDGINAIDSEEIAIYPKGEFELTMETSDGNYEPVIFSTPQERAAFSAGMHHGVTIMGGTIGIMDRESKNLIQDKYIQQKRNKMN